MEEIHSTSHIQSNTYTTLPGDFDGEPLALFVFNGVMKKVEQVAVVAILGDEADRVHHQSHEDHNVGMTQGLHEGHLGVEVADGLGGHSTDSDLLDSHFTASIH